MSRVARMIPIGEYPNSGWHLWSRSFRLIAEDPMQRFSGGILFGKFFALANSLGCHIAYGQPNKKCLVMVRSAFIGHLVYRDRMPRDLHEFLKPAFVILVCLR